MGDLLLLGVYCSGNLQAHPILMFFFYEKCLQKHPKWGNRCYSCELVALDPLKRLLWLRDFHVHPPANSKRPPLRCKVDQSARKMHETLRKEAPIYKTQRLLCSVENVPVTRRQVALGILRRYQLATSCPTKQETKEIRW